MPGHALIEKPFEENHIMEAIKLALGERDG
jgi:hypothetical protein